MSDITPICPEDVLADGVGSVNRGEVRVALARLAARGAAAGPEGGSIVVSSSEAFLYEVMADAAVPEFRDVLKIVKAAAADTAEAMALL